MPQPEDSLALIKDQPEDFDAGGFLAEFGRYRWTYVVGFGEVLHHAVLANAFGNRPLAKRRVQEQCAAAVALIPERWKTSFSAGDWNDCDPLQVHYALKGRPLRFDKACIVVKALELAVAEASKKRGSRLTDLDVFAIVQLHPAVFVLTELEEWQFLQRYPHRMTELELKFMVDLKQKLRALGKPEIKTKQKSADFLSLAIQGHGITWKSAVIIRDAFKAELKIPVGINLLTDRSDGGLQKCSNVEGQYVGFNKDEIDKLRIACRLVLSA